MTPKKQNILITGGAGFIGANFVYKFLELGYQVHVLEMKSANLWRIKKIHPVKSASQNEAVSRQAGQFNGVKNKIKLHNIDLTNYKETQKAIFKINPDIVLHFATYGAYQRFQQDINLTIDTNIKGTINLINACNKIGVECFINTGTNSEYGIKDKPMKETDLLEPDNLYAITKASATMYCQMMAQKFDFPVVIMRPFAVYGPFEEKERLIPTIIKSCLKNNDLQLSSPDSVRDFIFIDDVISAYILAIKNIKKVKGEIFNLGTGKQHTVSQIVAMVKKITHSDLNPIYGKVKKAQTEPKMWVADISKAKKKLGWKIKYGLEEGLKKNIQWYKENLFLDERK